MIIVTQDQKKIINLDKVLAIWIDDNILNKIEPVFIINATTDETCVELGNYNEEERAEEVLRDIAHWYEIEAKVYRMPEE